jgi:hypothetical protein
MRTTIVALALVILGAVSVAPADVLYAPEGNRLRRYDIDSLTQPPLRQDVLIERASLDPEKGRDVNGPVCPLPDGSGGFVMGEDTGQPDVPPGWGVFAADGTQIGKLTATYFVEPQGDPFGCAFDAEGRLFTSEIGNSASGPPNGQLMMWFPPFDRYPGAPGTYPNAESSTHFCKLAENIGTAGSVAIDAEGRVYVAASRGGGAAPTSAILRFSPPFPTGPDAAGGCGRVDALGSPLADEDRVHVEVFIADGNVPTPNGIARAANGNWYVSSVLNGVIAEFDPNGVFVRRVLSPPRPGLPTETGNPLGIAVDGKGNLFYADLQLRLGPGGIGPGPNGKVRWISFDSQGTPSAPRIIRENLAFPDALGILAGTVAGCTDDCPTLCDGDCNGNHAVTVDELVTAVNIALGSQAIGVCDVLDADEDGGVSIDELISAVNSALNGCATN